MCLWAAVTAADQGRGLMGVTDLGGADGMVFRYSSPVATQFWMRDTVMPLSIAFFAADGSFVSATDMEPCLTGPADACARYAAAGPYVNAIEVPKGGLEALLMTPGSELELPRHRVHRSHPERLCRSERPGPIAVTHSATRSSRATRSSGARTTDDTRPLSMERSGSWPLWVTGPVRSE